MQLMAHVMDKQILCSLCYYQSLSDYLILTCLNKLDILLLLTSPQCSSLCSYACLGVQLVYCSVLCLF